MPETLLIPIYRVCGLLLPPVLLISTAFYITPNVHLRFAFAFDNINNAVSGFATLINNRNRLKLSQVFIPGKNAKIPLYSRSEQMKGGAISGRR